MLHCNIFKYFYCFFNIFFCVGAHQAIINTMFISFEGIDGSGKTTALQHLAQWLQQQGHAVLETREPGGTKLAERIRQLLLVEIETIDTTTEQLLLFAARHQHIKNSIKPALDQGKWVLCDRFTDSTYAYQGGDKLTDFLAQWVHKAQWPHKTFWFDIDVLAAAQRMKQRSASNRFDEAGSVFQHQVQQRYKQLHQEHPDRIIRIDAGGNPQQVSQQVIEWVQQWQQ